MKLIPVDYLGLPSAARKETPPPKSQGVPRAARSGVYVDCVSPKFNRKLGRAAVAIPVQSQSDWIKSLNPEFRDLETSKYLAGGQPSTQQKEGPDVLRLEMSAKANLPLAQTPPPRWCDARITFHHLVPYPIDRVAAYHKRAGIGPTRPALAWHRPTTAGPEGSCTGMRV